MSLNQSFSPTTCICGSNRGSSSSYGTYSAMEVKSAEEIRLEAAREAIRSRSSVFMMEPIPGGEHVGGNLQDSLENLFSNIHAAKPVFDELGGVEGIMSALRVDPTRGIDSQTISLRQHVFGINKIAEEKQLTFLDFYRAAWRDKTIIMLSVAAVISLVLGLTVPEPGETTPNYKTGWIEGFAILCSVFIVTSVTSINDYRKDQTFQRLTVENSAQPISVLRDGTSKIIDVTEIVVGDIVHISPGLVMPVDGFVVTGKSVVMDESSVTGENDPSAKNAEQPWVLAGTVVCTAEEAYIVAGAVGERSFGGKLLMEARGSGRANTRMTPLQVRLDDTADLIGRIGLSAALFLFTLLCGMEIVKMMKSVPGTSARHFLDYFLLCVAVVVVAVPEGLPLAVTIALAYSQAKMHKDNNQVRRLVACETMGGATQICSDKTGTLTQNVMSVVQGYVGMRYFQVKRPGDLPEKIELDGGGNGGGSGVVVGIVRGPDTVEGGGFGRNSMGGGRIPENVKHRTLCCIALNSSSEKVVATPDDARDASVSCSGEEQGREKEDDYNRILERRKKHDLEAESTSSSGSDGGNGFRMQEVFWKWRPDKGNKTDNALLDFVDRVLFDPACFSSSAPPLSTSSSPRPRVKPLPHQRLRAMLRNGSNGVYCIFPFTSDRKRMSVVVQEYDVTPEEQNSQHSGITASASFPPSTVAHPSEGGPLARSRRDPERHGRVNEEKDGIEGGGSSTEPGEEWGGVPLNDTSHAHGIKPNPILSLPFSPATPPDASAHSREVAANHDEREKGKGQGALVHYVKGGSDRVLLLCNRYMNEHGEILPLDAEALDAIYARVSQLAQEANRTIGIAFTVLPTDRYPPHVIPATEPEEDLIWLGVIGIQDPLRPEVKEAVQKCQVAGVTVRMCTGDNLDTAVAIAKQCGIFRLHNGDLAMTGEEFRQLVYDAYGDEGRMEKLALILRRMTVMGRSQPLDKQLLVLMLMMRGEVVAVTGDGTNDAPALRLAHVGFVMRSGTDVAVKSADIVLLDDNFRSVQRAVVWGRCVNDNIRKFVQLQLSINYVSVILTMVGSALSSGTSSPLTTVQLLWVNLIMDTLAALALATEEPTESCLLRGPTNRAAPLISRRMHANIILNAAYTFAITLAVQNYGQEWFHTQNPVELQTVVFNVFVLCILAHMINCRKLFDEVNMFEGLWTRSKPCVFVILFCIAFQAVAVQTFGPFMNVQPLRFGQWVGCVVFALEVWLVGLVVRLLPIVEPTYTQRFDFTTLDEATQDSLVKLSRDVSRAQEREEYNGQYLERASRTNAKNMWTRAIYHHMTAVRVVGALRAPRNREESP